MANSFYTLRFTDPTKPFVVVNPSTINGPATPTSTALTSGAASASTTLTLIGRGRFDYGETIQQNMVYMLEHFASDVEPTYATPGQLWFKKDDNALKVRNNNNTAWIDLAVSGGVTSDFNMSGFRITNLANATTASDALNRGYADARYVERSGSVMSPSANLTFSGGTVTGLPPVTSQPLDATSKTYVDSTVANAAATTLSSAESLMVHKTGDTMTGSLTLSSGNVVVSTGGVVVSQGNINVALGSVNVTSGNVALGSGSLTTASGNVVVSTGTLTVGGASTFHGTTTVNGALVVNNAITVNNASLNLTGPGSILNLGNNRITNVGSPISSTDGANKAYVDTAIASAGGDGVTYGGAVNSVTGQITLDRTGGLPQVVLAGAAAPFSHTHTSPQVSHDMTMFTRGSPVRSRLLNSLSYPQAPLNDILDVIDEYVTLLTAPVTRQIVISDGVTVTLPLDDQPLVGFNRLQLFVDGIKYIASEYATAFLDFASAVDATTTSGLAPSTTYSVNVTINGTLYTNVSITTPATTPIRMGTVVDLLDTAFVTLSIPATASFATGAITISSLIAGAGSSASIAAPSAGTNLLTSFFTPAIPVASGSVSTYGYKEDGIPFLPASSVTLHNPVPAGSVIEILVFPT